MHRKDFMYKASQLFCPSPNKGHCGLIVYFSSTHGQMTRKLLLPWWSTVCFHIMRGLQETSNWVEKHQYWTHASGSHMREKHRISRDTLTVSEPRVFQGKTSQWNRVVNTACCMEPIKSVRREITVNCSANIRSTPPSSSQRRKRGERCASRVEQRRSYKGLGRSTECETQKSLRLSLSQNFHCWNSTPTEEQQWWKYLG